MSSAPGLRVVPGFGPLNAWEGLFLDGDGERWFEFCDAGGLGGGGGAQFIPDVAFGSTVVDRIICADRSASTGRRSEGQALSPPLFPNWTSQGWRSFRVSAHSCLPAQSNLAHPA